MRQYLVTGMSCAACAARVEKAVSQVPGVTTCSVSLLTNSMGVEGQVLDETIIQAVEKAGYGAKSKEKASDARSRQAADEDALADKETPVLRKRLITSVVILLPLLYLSMGHMLWEWPLPHFFDENHVAMGLVQLVLTALIMVINQKFFINGFRSLVHRAPNMDALVALGASAAFLWSLYVLFAMTRAAADGNSDAVMSYMMDFYFESAAVILTLITVGKMLEARSKGRTTDALKGLMRLAPKTATVVKDGVEAVVPVEQVTIGDLYVVRPGENIPVDGIVRLAGGNLSFIRQTAEISDGMAKKADALSEEGKTPLFFAEDGKLKGIIAVADVIKEDSTKAIRQLKELGMKVVMLTGDNERTAKAIGKAAGVDEVIAGVLPDGKEREVRALQESGKVIMVGDGINDAPALTRADIGIAIGAGADVAIDAADVVLMKSRLLDVAAAVRLSRKTLTNIHQNLFWAFFYNVIGIPLAAGVFIPFTGWQLNPMFAAAAMNLSSFFVVTNALRLNLFKIYGREGEENVDMEKEIDTPLNEIVGDRMMARTKANLLLSGGNSFTVNWCK
ncbi:MAG: HAD-IC family P-type ATPase [Lachnospiraceae bacterium]|nr:HAD-IC family P-type ATPase [Lachnospiraceae bacterium]